MTDPVTVTTQKSWISRLGSALGGVLTGLVLILVGVVLLGWNEGRSVQSIRANKEGAAAVVPVAADQVAPANESRLIHLTGALSSQGQQSDAALGVSAEGVVLKRSVEFYHWVESSRSESRTKLGGGEETVTTYTYEQQWTPMPQDSSQFQQQAGHQNPAAPIEDEHFRAATGRLGGFNVDQHVIGQVSPDQPFTPTAEQAAAAGAALSRPASVKDGIIYIGANPASPQIGDMRVTYTYAPQNSVLSVIGQQTGTSIRPFATRAGSSIMMVRAGTASADEMFAQARAANQTLSWILRAVGLVVLVAAFGMILGPLGVLADVVPFIGSLVRVGTGLIAFACGLTVAVVVIAVSWIMFRPIIGIGLLVLAAGVIGFLIWRARQAGAQAKATA